MPFHLFYFKIRWEIAKTLWHIMICPFGLVRFRHFFLADVLTSMVSSLQNTAIITCYFKTGSFETATTVDDLKSICPILYDYKIFMGFLPYWFRFLQCLHRYNETRLKAHLVNAGKYFSDLLVPLVGLPIFLLKNPNPDPLLVNEVNAGLWLYLSMKMIATTYSLAWDIYMDWGLCRQNTPGHPHRFLRDKLSYGPKFYYWAIFADSFLRFWWIVPLFAVTAGKKDSIFN